MAEPNAAEVAREVVDGRKGFTDADLDLLVYGASVLQAGFLSEPTELFVADQADE
jgi:hypothetical protein